MIATTHKAAVKRSACDQCRAKRVRCLRAQDSTAACARCSYLGTRCVTGASGHPGRPPKQRLAVSPPKPHRTSTSRDLEVHAPAMAVMPASVVNLQTPKELLAHGSQPEFWVAPGDMTAFFDSPSPSTDALLGALPLTHQPSGPSQLHGLLSVDDEMDAMFHMRGESTLGMDIDPLLGYGEGFLPPTPQPQYYSATSTLVKFREEIDQRIAMIDAYYSDTNKVMQHCQDGGESRDVENPAALLLTCSKEFTDIIQGLIPEDQLHPQTEDALSTEILLLVLSSYLALMRLFDSLFQRIHKFLCQAPLESYQSIKVKSVLRIGGVSALQDMPLKTYAIGILDAIQGQVHVLERHMGVPTEYCLSSKAVAPPITAAHGIFSRTDRARLFWTVMAQEDLKSRRGSRSYVESIRANIKESMVFLDD